MKKLFLLIICLFYSVSFVYSKLDINLEISFTYFAYFIPVHRLIAEFENVVPNTVQSVENNNCTFSFLYEPKEKDNNSGLLHFSVIPNDSSNLFFDNFNTLNVEIPFVGNCIEYSDDFMNLKCSVSELP